LGQRVYECDPFRVPRLVEPNTGVRIPDLLIKVFGDLAAQIVPSGIHAIAGARECGSAT
jgi:hypothetical protein